MRGMSTEAVFKVTPHHSHFGQLSKGLATVAQNHLDRALDLDPAFRSQPWMTASDWYVRVRVR